jgi:hypothetical protein
MFQLHDEGFVSLVVGVFCTDVLIPERLLGPFGIVGDDFGPIPILIEHPLIGGEDVHILPRAVHADGELPAVDVLLGKAGAAIWASLLSVSLNLCVFDKAVFVRPTEASWAVGFDEVQPFSPHCCMGGSRADDARPSASWQVLVVVKKRFAGNNRNSA